jgi:uncharacterized repeat protein (TIGR01451 family)
VTSKRRLSWRSVRAAFSRRASRFVLATLATTLVAGFVSVLPAQVASAAPISVTNCNNGGPGSLPAAVAAANTGDVISFAVSCPPGSPIATLSTITISTSLTISGPGASQVAVSGNGSHQVFHVNAGITVTISGITVENGVNNNGCAAGCGSSGGGIENAGTLTLNNDTVFNNSVLDGCGSNCGADGGGIENDATGNLTVTDSTITGNSANAGCSSACGSAGGGIENLAGGVLSVTDSTIAGNTTNTNPASNCVSNCVGEGAGIDNVGMASINASTVSGNKADNSCDHACGPRGGGIDNETGGVLVVHNSTVADNEANTGCGTNCAADGGGFFNNTGATATVTNTTISGNSVSGGCSAGCGNAGAGLDNFGTFKIGATIVANSTGASDCADTALTDLGYNLDDDGSCGFTTANGDLPDTPAGLDPAGLQDNGGPTKTIELQATSAAVDHVAANLCPATDQRGSPRMAPCDIGAYDTDGPASDGSQVHAVIEVRTSPSYAGDPVHIESTQLQASCGGTITFETLQGGTTRVPRTSVNNITVILDDDGNVTVVVDGNNCSPGSDVIEADLTVAPFLTAITTVTVKPPQTTPVGVTASPANEIETGDTAASGDSDVYTVFYVETNPVYAEQPVEISSPQLDNRCIEGWRWEPGVGAPINQASGTTKAEGILDDNGNATFVFKGISCAAGTSTVIADVEAGSHPTYVSTYTIGAPTNTIASGMKSVSAKANKKPKAPKPRRHPKKGKGGGAGTGSPAPTPDMTVDASPNPLVLTGLPSQGSTPAAVTITKTDDGGGSSVTNSPGLAYCDSDLYYTITVTNTGGTDLNGLLVSDDLADNPGLFGDSYTAAAGTGSPSGFTASGTGSINDTVDLPVGSSIVYTVDAYVGFPGYPPFLDNTATLTPPAGVTLTQPPSVLSADDFDFVACYGI